MKNARPLRCIFVPNIQNNVIMNWKFLNQPLGKCDMSGGFAPEKKHIWPAIIMAAAAAGSAIYGAAKSNSANRQAQAQLDAEKAITQAERTRKKYENPLDRADVQNVIRVAQQQADKIYKRAEGAAAVAGATDASKQMAKEAGNNMVAESVASIAANDAARKDIVDAQYRQEERAITQQQIALQQQKGQNIANAAGQVASALGSAAMSYAGTHMGAGSPGGGGVTAQQPATNQLNNMAGGTQNPYYMTPEMQMKWGMQNVGTLFGFTPRYHPAEK